MKINNIPGVIQAYNINTKEKNCKKNQQKVNTTNDNFEISQRAKDVAMASNALAKCPQTRQEKVQHIKEQIEQGTYTVDPQLIAQNMLKKG